MGGKLLSDDVVLLYLNEWSKINGILDFRSKTIQPRGFSASLKKQASPAGD